MTGSKFLWRFAYLIGAAFLCGAPGGQGMAEEQNRLPTAYEELTAPQFVQAVKAASGTCVIPLGIMEKHGAHLPLGTDLFQCREMARQAAEKEYTIIFPAYYFGQIFEARPQPGTLAYSQGLIWDLLEETCVELSRNGIKKIILLSGHGGNEHFLPYFCQAQLAARRDYAAYLFAPEGSPEEDPEVKKLIKSSMDLHGGERETSIMLAIRPELVHLVQAKTESGQDLERLKHLHDIYTGIWWFARFPNHYAGDASPASAELGRLLLAKEVEQLVAVIREVKADTSVLDLQKRFYEAGETPLEKVKR